MGNYKQIRNHFDFEIAPRCRAVCSVMSFKSKGEAYEELTRLYEVVEREVLSPLQSLDADLGNQTDFREFEESVTDLIVYLDSKITAIRREGSSKQDLVELGCGFDKAESLSRWAWLEASLPKVPGEWPDDHPSK